VTLVINTNTSSSIAQSNLSKVGDALQTTIQRLSSGLRVNTAADDASGFAIANRMDSQVRGMAVATRNANDAISFSQTTSGALSQISNNLQRMRELAVQAANGSNSSSDTSLLNQEFSQLQTEVARIKSSTTFNGVNVFGNDDTIFQIGSNTTANDRVNMQGTALTSTMTLGTLTITDRDTISGSVDITSAIAAAAAATGANLTSVQNAAVDAINSSQKLSFANKTDLLTNLSIAYAAASSAGTSVATFSTQIQVNMSSTILPGAYGAFTNYSVNSLTNGTLGTQQSINSNVRSAIFIAGEANGASLMSVYTAAVAVISAQSGSNNTAVLNQLSNALAYARTSSNTDNMSARAFSGALLTNFTSASSGGTAGTPSTFANNYGGGITRTSATVVGSSSTAGTLLNVNTATTGQTNAQAAINAIDNALTEVNTASAVQGALQNRFTAVISNLSAFSQSQTAAKSRIVDADFAAETARLSKNQILQQASTAMLAQANQIPSTVLSLLK